MRVQTMGKAWLAGAAFSALAAGGAHAEAPAAPVDLDAVVITALRVEQPRAATPATVQVIGEDELATQAALSQSAVEAVAALAPSFSPTRQKLSGFGETVRGRSPLYLVDGVPQSTPLRDDSRDGFTIDPFFIERVEVVFGSNAIQGIGATGGVVNYVTAPTPREADGWAGKVMAQTTFDDEGEGDSFGYKAAGLVGRDFGRWDFTAGAAYETRGAFYDADGRRIGPDSTQGDIQDSKSWSLFGKAGFDLTDTRRIEVMANHFELEGDGDYVLVNGNRATGLPTTGVRGAQRGRPPRNKVTSVAATYRDRDLLGGTLTAQAYGHDYEGIFGGGFETSFQDPRIAPVGQLFDQSANNSEKLGFKIDYEREVGAVPGLKALVGLDGIRDKTFQMLIQTDRFWVPETIYESLAPFVQLRQALWDGRVHLSAGARQENATLKVDDYVTIYTSGAREVAGGSPSFKETLFNVGGTVTVVDGVTAYASYAQGFTMPDVGRVLRAINTPGQDIDSYLDVQPVVSDNVELGVEVAKERWRGSLAWFQSNSDRGALLVRNANGVFDVQRQRTEIEGFEATLRVRATDWLTLGGAYSHLKGRTDGDGDGEVDRDLNGANISPDRLTAYAEGTWGPASLRVQVQDFESRDFEGEPAANSFEGYTLVDAVGTWRFPAADVSLGVQNLLDEQYISYFSDTQNPTDNARYWAGRGRTVTLTVAKRF
ncbi:TonB-dependent receptor [Phenylobacterium sp.]|uniref:TonB-dependent receptor n=2 Tax=Phenylobacterium sp. TaxID=1871053 RepID=UPI00391DD946